jgi:hypothetical protein
MTFKQRFNSNKSLSLFIVSILLLSMVGFIQFPEAKATSSIFGNIGAGGGANSIVNRISGSNFTCSLTGYLSNITALIQSWGAGSVSCAIYSSSGNLIGQTSQVSVPDLGGNSALYTFPVTTNIAVTSGVSYFLVAWSVTDFISVTWMGSGSYLWQEATGTAYNSVFPSTVSLSIAYDERSADIEAGVQTTPPISTDPIFSSIVTYNATRAGNTTLLQIPLSSSGHLQGYIFNSNTTGASINSTYTTLSGSPTLVTINSTVVMPAIGNHVSVRWFANGTDGTWGNSNVFNLTSYSLTGLNVIGNQILTVNGTPLTLKGGDYSYFIDDENGSWMKPDGSIAWLTWDTIEVNNNLDLLRAWNCNFVEVFTTVQWWVTNSNNFQSHIEYFITQAASRNISVLFTFHRYNSSESMSGIYNPLSDTGNGYVNSDQDFINLWVNVTSVLGHYSNVLFQLWSEPSSNQAEFFNVTQECINAIRNIGVTNIIVVQWGYNIDYAFDYPSGATTLSWITDFPLTDPIGNLVYGTELWRINFRTYNGGNQLYHYSYADIDLALNAVGVYEVAAQYPLIINQIGMNLWAADQGNESAWFNNTLSLLNLHNISFAVWALPPWRSTVTQWGLVVAGDANYALDATGVILINYTGGTTYSTWLQSQFSYTITTFHGIIISEWKSYKGIPMAEYLKHNGIS